MQDTENKRVNGDHSNVDSDGPRTRSRRSVYRDICVCMRCGYKWFPNEQKRPKSCAGCKTKNWWRTKDRTFSGINGRPRKYHIDVLKPGQTMTLDAHADQWVNVRQAVYHFSVRTGRTFEMANSLAGIKVTRIK